MSLKMNKIHNMFSSSLLDSLSLSGAGNHVLISVIIMLLLLLFEIYDAVYFSSACKLNIKFVCHLWLSFVKDTTDSYITKNTI